jgi:biopolymer transport protein TolR
MAMTTATAQSTESAINVTPLIDVLLVLLIIFMVIQPSVVRGLSAIAPQLSSARSAAPEPPPILVKVEATASAPAYVIDNARLERSDLPAYLRHLIQEEGRRTVLIRASSSVDYADVAYVLNAGSASGAAQMALLPTSNRVSE